MSRYIVDILDTETLDIASSHELEVRDLADLLRLLEIDLSEAGAFSEFELDDVDLAALARTFGLKLPALADGQIALIRPRVALDELPYTVHTGRELALMLAGTKPLAVFSEYLSDQRLLNARDAKFAPHVRAGRLIRRERLEDDTRHLFYALPEEQWRIDAYLLMLQASTTVGWGDGFERMQGLLLGYSEPEMDVYFERIWCQRPA